MCYTAESATLQSLKYAIHRGDMHLAEELQRQLDELIRIHGPRYHVSAFAHPSLIVFTQQQPYVPKAMSWGLIPAWTKNAEEAKKIRTQTLNARAQTIFQKPAFRGPAKNRRCVIYLDAFYEHHHANKKTYPFRIATADGSPLAVAGLWDEWIDKDTGEIMETCTIVTTTGNQLMSRIHNNPKAEMGPRMPVILKKEDQDTWLAPCRNEEDYLALRLLLKPFGDGLLRAHPVAKISGKNAIGNVPGVREPVHYADLPLAGETVPGLQVPAN